MAFTRAKPSGYSSGDKMTSTEANTIDVNAASALDARAGFTATLASVVTETDAGRLVPSVKVTTDGNATYTVADGIRRIDATTLTANREYTLSNTGAVLGDRVSVRNKSLTYTVTIRNAAATSLLVLGGPAGEVNSAEFHHTGSVWELWAGGPYLLAPKSGGTGLDDSAANGIVKYTSGTPSVITAPASAVVGTTDTQTLSAKTLASPTLTGAIDITGFTTTTTTSSDSKVVTIDAMASVQTTDATVTTAYASSTLTDNAVHNIDVIVTAIKSDYTAAAVYKRNYSGRRASGVWTQLASTADSKSDETTAAWDCTVDLNSGTFRVRVTGVAANTIRWGVAVRAQSTVL